MPDEVGVVVVAGAGDLGVGLPDFLAEGGVVGVLEDGEEGGDLEGEAPLAFVALGCGVLSGGGFGGVWKAGEAGFVGDEEFEGVGGVEDVFGEFLGDLGEFGRDFGDAGFLVGREVGAGGDEVVAGFFEESLVDGGECGGGGAFFKNFEFLPEGVVEGDGGGEFGDEGEEFVEGVALGGGVGDGVEVIEAAPGVVEVGGGLFEGLEGVGVGEGVVGGVFDGFDGGAGVCDGEFDVGGDVFGGEVGPADVKVLGEERMCLRHGEIFGGVGGKTRGSFWINDLEF